MNYWFWIHVYNYETVIGSFYTAQSERELIVQEINEKYGEAKWTRFTSE